ncbi:hypothetical protein QR692_06970 [Lactococcus petauri]|uniref:hypothetical protein n=1 Tax=Lactococcus petauri TaxID=1940789 RepID=UPI00256FF72F|nr:hypothetical protein [Lactococcus petauri]WJE11922.1 hypothetical protein QR692_06970 [Lactococcus petauri]
MSPEKKRKLRNITLLVLLGLVGGTFAFTAFNQQAINDRLRENPAPVGARVHDYFSRQTENKDVFVENYGQEPIMARIRLSEFMEYQRRGQTGWTQVAGGDRHDSSTWTFYRPEAGNINSRSAVDDSSNFNQYSTLTFGWERDNQEEPWYLPTFNHDSTDLTTAAAGDAQDYLERGATHPGDGKDNFWQANVSYTNGQNDIVWPGSTEGTRTTSQNLRQERNPITLQEWRALRTEAENDEVGRNKQIGNFWVMDPETGWAYWANRLNPGQATSYLIDEARMEDAARAIQGSYYYAIHVDSELINVSAERFSHEDQASANLEELLDRIRVGADGNASPQFPAPVRDFTFSEMRPRRIFTMGGQQFRYLEEMPGGNHMIIRNGRIADEMNWEAQEAELNRWYLEDFLAEDPEIEQYVAPVASTFTTGMLDFNATDRRANGVIFNLNTFDTPFSDRTSVVSSGVRRAFALSVADVNHLTQTGSFTVGDRAAAGGMAYWLRTPSSTEGWAWGVNAVGTWGHSTRSYINRGVRPVLIIHQ